MLKFGEKIISDIYLGDKKIAKVFLGDKLVYQAGKPIFLDYVRFDGASYIDTGIPYQTCTIECDIKFEETGKRQLMGFGTGTGQFWGAGATGIFDYMSGTNALDRTLVVINFNATEKTVTVNADGKTRTGSKGSSLSSHSYRIGTAPTGVSSSDYWCTCEVWGNKFTNADGELVQDLRPCIDLKGTVCFYDMVTKKYFYNKGTGILTAGNVIKFVDYIETDGKSYIDTEFKPNPLTTQLDIELMLLDDSTVTQAVFGCRGSTGADGKSCNIFYNVNSTKCIRIDWSGSINIVVANKNELISISCLGNNVIINGTKYTGLTPKVDTYLTVPILLGNMYNATQVFGTGSKIRIYNCKINDNGILARDLRPCVVAGEAGLYDMVTGKVFTNAGTGTLKANGRFVKSIIFDGASYINTGVLYQTCTVKTETKFSLTGTRQLMGFSGSSPIHYWGCNTNGNLDPLTSVSGLEFKEIEIAYNKDNADNKTLTITADGKSAVKTGKMDATNFYLIGCIEYGSYSAECEVKYNEIYVNGELIQDLRPYVDENGTACFKDIVTGNLFYNQGTGTLGYTEE